MFAQMTRYQLDGFARAYQQHCDRRERFKDLPRQRTSRKSDRHSAGTDICFSANAFRDRERFLEHAFQFAGLHMTFLRIGKRFFNLTEDLRLPQNQ